MRNQPFTSFSKASPLNRYEIQSSTTTTHSRSHNLQYLLPFVTLLLEHWLELIELCSRETLDIREWKWVEITATNVREFVVDRISFLQGQSVRPKKP